MASAHSTSRTRVAGQRPKGTHGRHSPAALRRPVEKRHNTASGSHSQGSHQDGITQPPGQQEEIPVPARLRPFLESERDSLVRAQSLLECIAHSMDHADHPVFGPYYPDVARLAANLIKQRTKNLDELLLDGRLPQFPPP
jgi:hypothetical protein